MIASGGALWPVYFTRQIGSAMAHAGTLDGVRGEPSLSCVFYVSLSPARGSAQCHRGTVLSCIGRPPTARSSTNASAASSPIPRSPFAGALFLLAASAQKRILDVKPELTPKDGAATLCTSLLETPRAPICRASMDGGVLPFRGSNEEGREKQDGERGNWPRMLLSPLGMDPVLEAGWREHDVREETGRVGIRVVLSRPPNDSELAPPTLAAPSAHASVSVPLPAPLPAPVSRGWSGAFTCQHRLPHQKQDPDKDSERPQTPSCSTPRRAWARASRPLRSRLPVCVHLVVIPPAPRPVRSESVALDPAGMCITRPRTRPPFCGQCARLDIGLVHRSPYTSFARLAALRAPFLLGGVPASTSAWRTSPSPYSFPVRCYSAHRLLHPTSPGRRSPALLLARLAGVSSHWHYPSGNARGEC
ncbi:hypothetical protein B0H14DRAFT_3899227 [Mycena olivaceomarginata]|nr:hypothetical protein B0H14DRAFT_3899227 [Mycena olivaceomarginata]